MVNDKNTIRDCFWVWRFLYFLLFLPNFQIFYSETLLFTPISHHIYKVHIHLPFLSPTYNQSEKKKVPITHINVRERSKYTRVTVTKFGRGFTLPTTYTVTKVDGHKAMISI